VFFAILLASAQIAPTEAEVRAYGGLHAAAARGDVADLEKRVTLGENIEATDNRHRTPLHVAVYQKQHDAALALIRLGADPNKFEIDPYDIAAVANDLPMLRIALEGSGTPKAITSRHDGTALIAAAQLGHAEIVRALIADQAPLDHVNNLQWTALIEAIVLGNGDKNHTVTVRALVAAGADVTIPDGDESTPLKLAKHRRFQEMVAILERAGTKRFSRRVFLPSPGYLCARGMMKCRHHYRNPPPLSRSNEALRESSAKLTIYPTG
jgi:ankyrin repeat protein